VIVLPDPWDALCIGEQIPSRLVVSYEAFGVREELERLGLNFILAPVSGDLVTSRLLRDHAPSPDGESVIAFKPSARLEETNHRFALAPSSIAGGIENKLRLKDIAREAGVKIARQGKARVEIDSFKELASTYGLPFVAQSPRGFAGRRTFKISCLDDWDALCSLLPRRPVKVASWAAGRPGTSNAVVDQTGCVVVSAPILQLTGDTDLTPHRLGSCGNDFTWRPGPHPGDLPAEIAEALGPVLAQMGFRGHFGIDWVWDGTECTLIEINARLTASFGLYIRHRPALLHAHVAATDGGRIKAGRLAPFEGGQLVAYNVGSTPTGPLVGPECWPVPGVSIAPGAKRGRLIVGGPVVDEAGTRLIHLPPS
jgi:hypothetical protein